jgi:CheY-like chemotaxis protein
VTNASWEIRFQTCDESTEPAIFPRLGQNNRIGSLWSRALRSGVLVAFPMQLPWGEFSTSEGFRVHKDVPTMSPHLMIVEDDPEMRDLLRKVLEKDGYLISLAANCHEAVSALGKDQFDLVVTDMLMPHDGGLELLETLRSTLPDLPVIIITAFGDWQSYSRALELGAVAFISKPLKMAELTAAIHTALAGRGAGQIA